MCFSRNYYIEFTDPSYDELLHKLELYLNTEYSSTFRVSMSTSDKNLNNYFIVEDINRFNKLIIYYKLKLIKNKKINTIEDISHTSLLPKNNKEHDYYRLSINTKKIYYK